MNLSVKAVLSPDGHSVYRCVDTASGYEYAVKMQRGNCDKEAVLLEDIQRTGVEGVIGYHGSYSNSECVAHVMDFAAGGDLFSHIENRPGFGCLVKPCLPEQEAAELFVGLLRGLSSFHRAGFIHRDVKLENVLLSASPSRFPTSEHVLLSDFGASCTVDCAGSGFVGTHGYIAPEAYLGAAISPKVDSWASGVILYTLLSGLAPFQRSCHKATRKLTVHSQKFLAEEAVWDGVSFEAKDLISRLLLPNPDQRISIDAALEHQWVIQHL